MTTWQAPNIFLDGSDAESIERAFDRLQRRLWDLEQILNDGIASGSSIISGSGGTVTYDGFLDAFYDGVLNSTCGSGNDGYFWFTAATGQVVPGAFVARYADMMMLDRVGSGGTVYIRNVTTGAEGAVTVPAVSRTHSGLSISPNVVYNAGDKWSARAEGSTFGSGLRMRVYG